MPVPPPYYRASEQFERFMLDARDAAELHTTNMAWNMVVGVLQAFRRRVSLKNALLFANLLPPGIRALFVADWDADETVHPFVSPAELLREIRSVRTAHNFAPDNAHLAVAIALRRNVDTQALDGLLQQIGEEAYRFWFVEPDVMRRAPQTRELLIQCRAD
ncbi:Uncharacterized conserved protein, DUF2267 family [Pseudomonas cuatrocienegasensis]|uniref:Uncharacterized conserved protein, DUF2267 family n=1 Tax=Pseudomonas cuatrocienegasensis TaxID=543360 RepID=A0ABY1B5B4_9PSED|nr:MULTISPECIES: DUF2267 domain-containing protein [Pseudomonas]OEC37367.1 hypothetical protein A7D25_01510 [Pseudomonas sp. 21C1]SEP94252.1 Uncharacterized conserved protein, DUF2267 family [Pseudomonas cuatrocienegasensis]